MEKSVLKQYRIPESNTNQTENNFVEPTAGSPNYPKIQNNINDLSDPPSAGKGNSSTRIIQSTEDNELQPIINNKNAVFDNVDTIFTIFNSCNINNLLYIIYICFSYSEIPIPIL